jgi:transposase
LIGPFVILVTSIGSTGMKSPIELRRLGRSEWRQLKAKLRERSLPVRLHRRYRIIAERRAGHAPAAAADRVGCGVKQVTYWTRRFNVSGFTTFERPSNPTGREPILLAKHILALIEVALSSPSERGLPFSRWSVAKLKAYCVRQGLMPAVTDEWVRRVLRRQGLSAQRVRTWKQSHDPAFDRKKTASSGSTGTARAARPSSHSTSGGRSN